LALSLHDALPICILGKACASRPEAEPDSSALRGLCCARGAGHRTGAPPLVPAAPGGRAPGASRGVLAGTAAAALDGDDATGLEELAGPDAPEINGRDGTVSAAT